MARMRRGRDVQERNYLPRAIHYITFFYAVKTGKIFFTEASCKKKEGFFFLTAQKEAKTRPRRDISAVFSIFKQRKPRRNPRFFSCKNKQKEELKKWIK